MLGPERERLHRERGGDGIHERKRFAASFSKPESTAEARIAGVRLVTGGACGFVARFGFIQLDRPEMMGDQPDAKELGADVCARTPARFAGAGRRPARFP